MIKNSLKRIAWDVPEEEYRAHPALSYSNLSKYERGGFGSIATLFDKVESPHFLFGSAVDTQITEGLDRYLEKYWVGEVPEMGPAQVEIIKTVISMVPEAEDNFALASDILIAEVAKAAEYQKNWKAETIVSRIRETAETYLEFRKQTEGKEVIPAALNQEIGKTVECLQNNPTTENYFRQTNPLDDSIEYLDQMKFKAVLEDGIEYRCMLDRIICNYASMTIQPIDLKTSSKPEWDFFKSFVDYRYDIQARLYWRILRKVMDNDPVFKDFKLLDFKFIVINKLSLTPLVWVYPDTIERGELTYGQGDRYKLRDPEDIGKELTHHLKNLSTVPSTINQIGDNDLNTFLTKL